MIKNKQNDFYVVDFIYEKVGKYVGLKMHSEFSNRFCLIIKIKTVEIHILTESNTYRMKLS